MNLKVLDAPAEDWVDRLQKGHWVYLPKEKEFARVAWPWMPPEPGHCAGEIVLHRLMARQTQTWYVRSNGTGLDFYPLILPVEDNLPDEVVEVDKRVAIQMQRALHKLEKRIERIERYLHLFE